MRGRARADPEPWKSSSSWAKAFQKSSSPSLDRHLPFTPIFGPFSKSQSQAWVEPQPFWTRTTLGPKSWKSWKTLIWCLPLFWVKWLKPIIHILLWRNFFELSCRMKSKKIHIKVETHLEAYFLRLFIFCLGTSPYRCEQCLSLLWNMNDENNQI